VLSGAEVGRRAVDHRDVPPAWPRSLAADARAHHRHTLAGTITGTYTVGHGLPDLGTTYQLTGAGTLGLLGGVTASGSLQAIGFIMQGRATGTLTLANAQGTLTLHLEGPVQAGFAALPQLFHFTFGGGTGTYQHLTGGGTLTLKLNSLLTPKLDRLTILPFPGGTFTLSLQQDFVPPLWATQSGIEGVAMVGPISPVVRHGVAASRPLPGALISVRLIGGGEEIARVRADDHGKFQLRLEPGSYLLVPLPPKPGQPLPRGLPQTVTVPADGFAPVVVNYDSGIQ
jgi:hypothetical protein